MSKPYKSFITGVFLMLFCTTSYASSYTMVGDCALQYMNDSGEVVLVNLKKVSTANIVTGRVVLDLGEDAESIKLSSIDEVKRLYSDIATCLNDGKRVAFDQ